MGRRALGLVVVPLVLVAVGCSLSVMGTDDTVTDGGKDASVGAEASSGDASGGGGDDGSSVDGSGDGATVSDGDAPVPPDGSAEVPIDAGDAGMEDADADAGTPPAFEILAPDGGSYTILAPGAALPCSVSGGAAVTFQVENYSTDSLAVRWVDYSCQEKPYGTVSPNKAKSQATYVGHRWRLRNTTDGGIRGDYVLNTATAAPFRVIVR